MTVQDLIELLSKEDPDRLVVLAEDAEGNHYCPLSGGWSGSYFAETTYSGRMGLEELTEEDRSQGYTEEDVVAGVPALCLTPVN